jgi:hypothetical protein
MSFDAQFRQKLASPAMAPPWFVDGVTNGASPDVAKAAVRFLYCLGLCLDMLDEKANEAQLAKLPGFGTDPSLLPFQAADRLLIQGPQEPSAQFIVRLQQAFDSWARAGSRPAVLEQIQGYLTDLQPGVAAALPECLIVGGNTTVSTWDTINNGDPQGQQPAHAYITPANWNWDGVDNATRAWLVLFMHLVPTGASGSGASVASVGGSGVSGVTSGFATITGLSGFTAVNIGEYLICTGGAHSGNNGTFQIVAVPSSSSVIIANTAAVATDTVAWSVSAYPFIGPAPVYGSPSFVWGQGYTWGVNCSSFVIQSIRQIVQRWKSASTYYPNIIISFGGGDATAGNEFSPNSSQGSGNPDGTWAGPGKLVNGCWVPARTTVNPFTAFCDGTGVSVQCYEKNRT